MLDVDSSIHQKQVDLDYAASFNNNEISGINDTYIVILIMSEYCRRGQHFNGRDNFVDECVVNACERSCRSVEELLKGLKSFVDAYIFTTSAGCTDFDFDRVQARYATNTDSIRAIQKFD